jgi:hypothetical protein
MNPALASLSNRIAALHQRRRTLRQWTGLAASGLAALCLLMGLYVLDRVFDFTRLQRAAVVIASLGLFAWVFRRWTWPWMQSTETPGDVVVLVERRCRVDTDYIAALQFDKLGSSVDSAAIDIAGTYGDRALRSAVISRAVELDPHPSAFDEPASPELRRRRAGLIFAAAAALVVFGVSPQSTAIFLQRLLFADVPYLTKTRITELRINDTVVAANGRGYAEVRVAAGATARFAVRVEGVAPESGVAWLRGVNGVVAPLTLQRVKTEPTAAENPTATNNPTGAETPAAAEKLATKNPAAAENPAAETFDFTGETTALSESLTYELVMGDDRRTASRIVVAPLPVVTMSLRGVLPAGARRREGTPLESVGSRMLLVEEGTAVTVHVQGENKPLSRVTVRIGDAEFAARATDQERRQWELPPSVPPLDAVFEPVSFRVVVIDDDALSPTGPLQGEIRIRPDAPPRVVAAAVTTKVLPKAKPVLGYGASDDVGLTQLRVRWKIQRSGSPPAGVPSEGEMPLEQWTADEAPRSHRGQRSVDLGPLSLVKGDGVELVVEASDVRPAGRERRVVSEPVILQVTDEAGVFASLAEADEQSAKQLDQIIERQLGLGESR